MGSAGSTVASEPSDPVSEVEALFRSQRRRLWGLAYRLTGNAEDADESSRRRSPGSSRSRPLWPLPRRGSRASPRTSGSTRSAAAGAAPTPVRGSPHRVDVETRLRVTRNRGLILTK